MKKPILEVKNLKVSFQIENQSIEALKGISFKLFPKEIVALVGESGSGKSVTCQAILDILPNYAKISGNIIYNNKNLKEMNWSEKRKIRGKEISMIFQEPSAVLNPLLTIGEQIVETILAHQHITLKEAKEKALKAMENARIPNPEQRFNQYPHEMSGGLKQRVAIAVAIANYPKILLADEPTTALDVTVSAQILKLFNQLKEQFNLSIFLITHDLGIVAEIADRVLVIYKGEIVEEGNVFEIFENPKHPYTKKLLESRPSIEKAIS